MTTKLWCCCLLLTLVGAGVPVVPLSAAEAVMAADFARGPHRGRLLEDAGFAVELAIFEDGVPPEYHAWATLDGKPLLPTQWQLRVVLTRLGGRVDEFSFSAKDDFLLGSALVEEPHSFDVAVEANYQGQAHRWQFPSYEGRVQLSSAMVSQLQLGTAVAAPGVLHQSLLLYGRISVDPQRVSHVSARYPGLVRTMDVALGQQVQKGVRLATIETNTSLQTYSVTAPISGRITEWHANAGQAIGAEPLVTIVDHSQVMADFDVFPADRALVQPGQRVHVQLGDTRSDGDIQWLQAGASASALLARVPLANPSNDWIPGLLVEGKVQVAEVTVPLLVDNRALQGFRDWQVVFIKVGDTYEIRPLALGRTDGYFTEVISGLKAGDEYVVTNSYLLKADLEKSGASHDH